MVTSCLVLSRAAWLLLLLNCCRSVALAWTCRPSAAGRASASSRHISGATITRTRASSNNIGPPLPSSSLFIPSTTALKAAAAATYSQTAVLDGAEWWSVARTLRQQGRLRDDDAAASAEFGVLRVVAGSNQAGERVVGMVTDTEDNDTTIALDDDSSLHADSVARIPESVSNAAAVRTMIHAVSSIHCVLPVLQDIGGSNVTSSQFGGKVVVLGGSDYAVAAAKGLAALGCQVSLVTTRSVKVASSNIQVLKPAVGETGFCQHLGKFDAVLDTVGDEHDKYSSESVVIRLLQSRHDCHIYVSTWTAAQMAVAKEGLIWGRQNADKHVQSLSERRMFNRAAFFPPPANFGATVERLLQAGVTWPATGTNKEATYVRGWSLADFWEGTTWPQHATANVRFGLPVPDNDDEEDVFLMEEDEYEYEERLVSAPPERFRRWVQQEKEKEDALAAATGDNPYVMSIVGVKGLEEQVVKPELDCLLFLSAPFCRICRYLQPQYQRMARIGSSSSKDNDGDNMVFAKADAVGVKGKALGRALQVDSVPTFVLFRGGERYGEPLSISRLPSKKLDLAIDYLKSGQAWDSSVFQDEDDARTKRRTKI